MRSHFVIRSLFFTGATLLSQFSNAEEAPKKQPMEIKPFIATEKIAWSTGREVMICDGESRSGVTCQIAKLPAALGACPYT